MPIRPTPIQVIRSRFNEITLWRSQGIPWSEISNELQVHANTLSILYQRELKRRTSPEYITATRWVSAHHDTIAELLARGFTWVSITNLIPVVPESNEAMPTLEMLVVEYGSITASHASGASPHRVPEPEPTSQLIPQAAAPVDPPTQQGIQALKTEHESSVIRIPSRRARLMQVVRATLDQTHQLWSRSKDNGHVN